MRKHKAILKGKVWEAYWEIKFSHSAFKGVYYSSSHQMDSLLRDRDIHYRNLRDMDRASCTKQYRVKNHEEFWTGDIDMPFLEVGERFFIADMNVEVVVEERVRTTKEKTCIYLVDYSIRTDASNNPKEAESYVVRKLNTKRKNLIKDIAELDKEIERLSEESLNRALEVREEEERESASERSGLVPWLKRLLERD